MGATEMARRLLCVGATGHVASAAKFRQGYRHGASHLFRRTRTAWRALAHQAWRSHSRDLHIARASHHGRQATRVLRERAARSRCDRARARSATSDFGRSGVHSHVSNISTIRAALAGAKSRAALRKIDPALMPAIVDDGISLADYGTMARFERIDAPSARERSLSARCASTRTGEKMSPAWRN